MTATQVKQPDIGHLADVPQSLESDAGFYDIRPQSSFRNFTRRSGIPPSGAAGGPAGSRARPG
jgi:hypothetical protein